MERWNGSERKGSEERVVRRGDTYLVRGNTVPDEDQIARMIEELCAFALENAARASRRGKWFRILTTVISLFIIVGGTVSAIILLWQSPTVVGYLAAALSFCITGAKSAAMVFDVEKGSIVAKKSAVQLQQISRSARALRYSEAPGSEILSALDRLSAEAEAAILLIYGGEPGKTPRLPEEEIPPLIPEPAREPAGV